MQLNKHFNVDQNRFRINAEVGFTVTDLEVNEYGLEMHMD